MTDATREFGRRAQVVIGKAGKGLLVENLRIAFEVTKTNNGAPNVAIIKIYNLNPTNEAKVKKEYDDVLINAGYEGAMRLIFRGNIKHVYRYRDNGTDFITEIEAADGDHDYRNATINETLAAGTTNHQMIDRAAATFSGGTTKGHVDVPAKTRLRGKVVSGNTRDVLEEVARDAGANWSIQDGQLTIVPTNKMLPNQAIVIRSDTGMLGSPEINDKGITVKCLLNPQIAVNGAVQLDNNTIKAKRRKAEKLQKPSKHPKGLDKLSTLQADEGYIVDDPTQLSGEQARLSSDGIYKVIKITHKGDTRGQDWQTESLCIAL